MVGRIGWSRRLVGNATPCRRSRKANEEKSVRWGGATRPAGEWKWGQVEELEKVGGNEQ